VPEEMKARAADAAKGESSLRGHLKAEGDEQGGSQSYFPPEINGARNPDDKAIAMALDLLRGTRTNAAFPPNPKSATLPN
jgi:carboxyl-terminal processing protease